MFNLFSRFSFLAVALLAVACVSFPAWANGLKAGCYPKQEVSTFLKNNHQSQVDQFYAVTYNGRKKTTLTAEHNGEGYVKDGTAYLIEADEKEACITAKMRVLHMGPDALNRNKIFPHTEFETTDKDCEKAIKDGREWCDTYEKIMANGKKHGEKVLIQGVALYIDKNGTEKEGAVLETIRIEPTEKGDGVILLSNIATGSTYPVRLINRSAVPD